MAKIRGIDNMQPAEITAEINRGARFVVYRYCLSAFVTLTKSTDVYFVRAQQSRVTKGMPWLLLTLVAGWWGFPWGPIRSVRVIWTNLRGGDDVTAAVANSMQLRGVDWVAISNRKPT